MPNLTGHTFLVTGGNGFVGQRLLEALAQVPEAKVHTADRSPRRSLANGHPPRLIRHQLDITDGSAVDRVVGEVKPDVVFHLAAQAHVPTSFADPESTWAVNLHGTLHLLRAAQRHCPNTTFINVASADPYGASFRSGEAVTEQTPFLPLNPYAASKAAADLAAYQEAAASGLRVIRARPFNHSGPGQSEGFVLPGFAAQIARAEAGVQNPIIRVGDLSAERDFMHIKDVVTAYILLAEKAADLVPGSAYNIASGRSWQIGDLLSQLIERSSIQISVEQDVARLRPSDIQRVCGNHDALTRAVGWQPEHSTETLLDDVLNYWRSTIIGSKTR